jgi:GTPase SAR1 family protein
MFPAVSEKTQQSFDTAMLEGEVWIRNGSVLLLGTGGSGKTHILAAFLKEDPPSARESTPCAKKPVRAVAHCKVGVADDHFTRITDDHYSDMLVTTVTAEKLPQTTNTVAITVDKAIYSQPGQNEITSLRQSLVFSFDTLQREETWCVRRAMKRQFLGRMQAGSKRSDLNDKDLLDISDTGGQPMFHEVLPIFIHNTMFGILTVKLNECLDSYPLVEYYTNGERVGEPSNSPFTHMETLHHCMRVLQSTCERHTCPKIAFIGTHKDLEHKCTQENRETKEKKLCCIIPEEIEDNIVQLEGESLLLAINAKEPSKDDKQLLSTLRERVMEELRKMKPIKIPLRYIPLEMCLQRMAKEQRKSVLSEEECFKVASTYNFTRESFKAALKYLHGLKLIFHYEDVLPNIVFIDAQALLDKITELVVHSLSLQAEPKSHLLGALKKFVKCGIVTAEILEKFKSHYIPKIFMKEHLISLFKYLRIMAEVGEGEYLVPCLLKKEDLPSTFSDTVFQTVSPLLFYFLEGGPKLGVYCFLVASLITEFKWKLLSENRCPVQVSRNRVKFELPGGNPGCITISDSLSTFFHVAIESPEGANHDKIRQICEEECPNIRETILTGIRKASQKLNYRNSIPEVAFPCLKHKDIHPATISSTGLLTCTNDRRLCSEISEQHHLWFSHKGIAKD